MSAHHKPLALACLLSLAACATSSGIIDAGDGAYVVQANASAIRGGETGALSIAVKDANDFCASKIHGHAVVLDHQGGSETNTVMQGAFAGAQFHPGAAAIKFRCET